MRQSESTSLFFPNAKHPIKLNVSYVQARFQISCPSTISLDGGYYVTWKRFGKIAVYPKNCIKLMCLTAFRFLVMKMMKDESDEEDDEKMSSDHL